MPQGHKFGLKGFTKIADTSTRTAGVGAYEEIEAWGPLFIYENTVFAAGCEVYAGDIPDTSKTYTAPCVIYTFMTKIVLTTAGLVHAQNIEDIQDF